MDARVIEVKGNNGTKWQYKNVAGQWKFRRVVNDLYFEWSDISIEQILADCETIGRKDKTAALKLKAKALDGG